VVAHSVNKAFRATSEAAVGFEDAAKASAELKDELTKQRVALEKLTAAKITAVGGTFDLFKEEIALADATADSTAKAAEATKVLNDGNATDAEKAQANRDIWSEAIKVAEQSLKVAEAYAHEAGAADGSSESARLQVEKLRDLQAQYPENAAAIQPYIDKLLAIPGVVDTTISLDTREANKNIDALMRKLDLAGIKASTTSIIAASRFNTGTGIVGGRIVKPEGAGATGAIVNRPTVALIGEAGPEALIPLNRTQGNGPLPSGGRGVTNITINTNADPQAVVEAIRQWERRNGKLY